MNFWAAAMPLTLKSLLFHSRRLPSRRMASPPTRQSSVSGQAKSKLLIPGDSFVPHDVDVTVLGHLLPLHPHLAAARPGDVGHFLHLSGHRLGCAESERPHGGIDVVAAHVAESARAPFDKAAPFERMDVFGI